MQFGTIRKNALKIWLEKTGRTGRVNDIMIDTLECEWQLADEDEIRYHNSFYCSLGEWNCHVTDLLKDRRYDKYDYANQEHRKALFRHYTRLLLVTSEVLTDFQAFLEDMLNEKQEKIRLKMTSSKLPFTCQTIFEYINNICKHKASKSSSLKYHHINHHLDYYFMDSKMRKPKGLLKIDKIKAAFSDEYMFIQVPSIISIVRQILFAYQVTDIVLSHKTPTMTEKLKKYESRF